MKYSIRYHAIGYRVDVVNEDGTVVKSFHAAYEAETAYRVACHTAEQWVRANNSPDEYRDAELNTIAAREW